MAVANYHEQNGHYPPAFVRGPGGRPWHSWRVLILPFIEESKLHAVYDFDEPWDGPSNRKLAERMPRIFAFHSERREGNTTTNYATVVGAGTAWPGAETISHSDVTDGLSQTIMIVENRGASIHWMEPRDLEFETMDFRLNQANGIGSPYDDPAVVLLDGSVQRLLTSLEPRTLRALLTIKGGEPIENDENKAWRFLPDGRLRPIRDD